MKRGRHHAGDQVRLAANHRALTDDRRIGVERVRPQRVADHRDRRTACAIFIVGEFAPAFRRDTEHTEIAGRHALLRHRHRAIAHDEIHAAAEAEDGHVDRRPALTQCQPGMAALRQVVLCPVGALIVATDHCQLIRMRIWEGAQQHAVDDREDRSICADAQRQREHGGDREGRRPQEHADRVSHVAHNATLDGSQRSSVASGV